MPNPMPEGVWVPNQTNQFGGFVIYTANRIGLVYVSPAYPTVYKSGGSLVFRAAVHDRAKMTTLGGETIAAPVEYAMARVERWLAQEGELR